MTKTAREVVAEYLRNKDAFTAKDELTKRIEANTREIVDELPDGFTMKDVRTCVAVLNDADPELTDMSNGRRSRRITKAVDEMVADGLLNLDGSVYSHVVVGPTHSLR